MFREHLHDFNKAHFPANETTVGHPVTKFRPDLFVAAGHTNSQPPPKPPFHSYEQTDPKRNILDRQRHIYLKTPIHDLFRHITQVNGG